MPDHLLAHAIGANCRGTGDARATGQENPAHAISTIVLVLVVLLLLGALPTWPHSRSWGYGPTGGLSLVLIVLLVMVLTGRL